jgi:DNA-binding cell septation regulator SpoVG
MGTEVFENVKVFPTKDQSKGVHGYGSVLVAGVVECKFTVRNGKHGLFAQIPAAQYIKDGETKYTNHYYFPEESMRKQFQTTIINEFNKMMGKDPTQGSNTTSGEESQMPPTPPALDDGIGF